MFTVLMNLTFGITQHILLGIGGTIRWFLCKLYNALYFEKFSENFDYYVDNKNNIKDKNGFTVANKNFFAVLILILIFLLNL